MPISRRRWCWAWACGGRWRWAQCSYPVLFLLVTLFKLREMIVNGILHSIRIGIIAGIGLFLAIIALKNAGIVLVTILSFFVGGNQRFGAAARTAHIQRRAVTMPMPCVLPNLSR